MDNKYIAIFVVAILALSGAGVYLIYGNNSSDEPTTITIVDAKDNTIELSEPLDKVAIVNTNIPVAMRILGLTDKVVGIDTSTLGKNDNAEVFTNAVAIGARSAITGESILAAGTNYVITPVSMGITSNTDAIEQMGITIIYIDCYGETAIEDLQKILILFGNDGTTKEKYDVFMENYDGIISSVDAKVAEAKLTQSPVFLQCFISKNAFYNQTAATSKMMEDICGKNVFNYLDASTTNISNDATDLGIREVVIAYDGSATTSIDFVLIRDSSKYKDMDAYDQFVAMMDGAYTSLSAVQDGDVYVMYTDIMSGYLSYVGYAAMAEIFGVDTGLDFVSLIEDFNDAYGTDYRTTELLIKVAADGTSEELLS